MPPVIAFIKAGITFIATAGAAGSAMAALTIVTTTLSFAATRMIKNKLNFSVDDNDRSRQTTVRSTTEPRKLVYGETMVSGPLTYAQVSGANNKYLHQVVALAGHELTQISKIFLDDKSIDLTNGSIYNSTTKAVTSGFFGPKNDEGGNSETVVYIDTRLGTASQTAYAGLRSDSVTSQEYLSTHRGDNVASLYTRWTINEGSREVWDEVGNVQNIKALVKGKKIYDPRLEVNAGGTAGASPTNASYVVYDNDTLSTASIDRGDQGKNPALIIADYLMDDEFGLGIPSSKIDWAAIIAAADDCDTLVPIPNSATQKRFFGSGVIFGADPYAKSIEKILSGMNGSLVYSQGKYIVRAGVYVAPTESITEDDIIGEVDIRTAIPRSDRLNQIKGLFIDPTEQYKMMEFGPVTVSGAISRDNGEVLEEEIKLPFTDNRYAAQRIAFKQVNQSFLQTMITVPVNLKGMRIAVGDRVNVYLSDLESVDSGNWNPKIFKCINWSFAENGSGGINLTLLEDAQTRYADPSATGGPNNSGDYSTITAQGVIARNLPDVPAPTNFSITAAINSIELNWDNPSNALAWEQIWVYRSTSSTTPTDSATPIVKFRGTSYTDQRAADGTEYYYWIQAVRYPQGSTPASGTNTSKSVMVASSPVKIAATKIGITVMGANSVDTTQIVNDAVGSAQIDTTIQSDNWASTSGAEGWQINKAGSATFQTATIKGGITATSGAIGGLTIGSDKVYVGTGTFNNANTAFYVDDQGQLSLKDKLSWDGTDLTISGSVTATSGTFDGTVNASAGAFTGDVSTNSKFIAGSSEDVAVVDGGDSLYRFYAGNSNPTNAAFRVDKDGHIDATNIRIYDTNGQVILDDSGLHGVGLGNISADSGVGVAEVAGRLDNNADEITFTTSSSNEVYTFQPKVQIDINQDAGSGESPSTSNLSFAGADQSAVTTIIGQVKLIVEYFVKTSGGSYSGTPTATQEFTFVSGTSANSSQLGVNIFTLNSRGAGVIYANIGASEAISDPSIAGARTFVKSSADLTFANAGTYNIKVNARIATLAGTTLTTSTTPALDASATTGTGVILGTDETQSSLEDFRRLYIIKPASGNTKTIIASTTDDTFSSTSGSSLLTTGGTISGSLVVTGDLTVQGTTTTVDTDNLTVKDNNITLNYSTGDSSSTANNAGITIQDGVDASTDATILWKTASDTFEFSHAVTWPSGSSTNANTAYTYSQVGHLPLAGGTLTGNLSFGDNNKAIFGAGSDLQIYHDGSNSYITDAGTGDLLIRAENNLFLKRTNSDETYLSGAVNGAVTLFHNNNAKIATTISGIDVTGSVTADGGTIVSTGSDAFSSKAVGGYAIQAYQDATASGHTALDLRSDATAGTRYLIRGYNNAAVTPTEVFSVGADGTVTADGLTVDGGNTIRLNPSSGDDFLTISQGTADANITADSTAGNANLKLFTTASGTTRERLDISFNGDISFYEDTGTTAKLFWDASAERLGIGTASPDSILHLSGSSSSKIIIEDSANPRGNYIGINSSDNLVIAADEDNLGSSSNIQFRVDATERMRIDASGNVGIGVTNVGAPLDIGSASPKIRLTDTGGGYSELRGNGGVMTLVADAGNTVANSAVAFETDGTERMRLDASGNLLVGTTDLNPQSSSTESGTRVGDGFIFAGRAGEVAILNRQGSDGTIADFRKDGTTVGSIGSLSGIVTEIVLDPRTNGASLTGGTNKISPGNQSGALDAHLDLGSSGHRFKDLYLSGNAYVGNAVTSSTDGSSDLKLEGNQHIFRRGSAGSYAEQARINASGNFLVGKTSDAINVAGVVNYSAGIVRASRNGNSGQFGRISTDGDIVTFYKDTVTVGSIQAVGGDLNIGTGDTALLFVDSIDAILPTTTANPAAATRDNAIDLGRSATRFKDLHLSGVAYNGDGSASAPSISFGADTNTGFYRVGSDQIGFVTAGTIKAKLDASGNFLVGTTDTLPGIGDTNAGVSMSAVNGIIISRANDAPINMSRNSSDGALTYFRKDGAIIGSIASKDGDIAIGTGDTGFRFIDGSDAISPHNISTNAGRDAAIDLGTSGGRFKDLHLSNNAYVSNIYVNGYIYHNGDTNSYIRFVAGDDMQLVAGGRQMIRMDEGANPDVLQFVVSTTYTDSNGNIVASGNVTAYASDRRLKTNIKPIENALEKIKAIRGVTYDWKDEVTDLGFHPERKTDCMGVIAQELEEAGIGQVIRPAPFDQHRSKETDWEFVSKSGQDYKTVDYDKLTALCIQGIKEQQQEIDELKTLIKKLMEK